MNIYFDQNKTYAAIIYYRTDFSVLERDISFNFRLIDDTLILIREKHKVAKSTIHFMQVKLQLNYLNTLRR